MSGVKKTSGGAVVPNTFAPEGYQLKPRFSNVSPLFAMFGSMFHGKAGGDLGSMYERKPVPEGHYGFETPYKNIHFQPDKYETPVATEYKSVLPDDFDTGVSTAPPPVTSPTSSPSLTIGSMPFRQGVRGIKNTGLAQARKRQGGVRRSTNREKLSIFNENAQGTGLHT